jgi:hypothetical protein
MMAVVDLADHHGGKKLKETNLPCALWPRRILSTGGRFTCTLGYNGVCCSFSARGGAP